MDWTQVLEFCKTKGCLIRLPLLPSPQPVHHHHHPSAIILLPALPSCPTLALRIDYSGYSVAPVRCMHTILTKSA